MSAGKAEQEEIGIIIGDTVDLKVRCEEVLEVFLRR